MACGSLSTTPGWKVGSPTVYSLGTPDRGDRRMATAQTDVLKPDHGSHRRHFIFTEEHEQLRESIGSFVTRELAPHAMEWEETTFPDWVFRRMGELGFLGLTFPQEYGGQGGGYYRV